MEYGLIGGRLGHSYSKVIHEMLCGYRYDLCPLPTEEEVRAFLARRQFRAINVTIPYKLVVMEYCSYIDPHAKAINAVNTIVNRKRPALRLQHRLPRLLLPVRCTRCGVQGQDGAHSGHRRHPQHHLGRGP